MLPSMWRVAVAAVLCAGVARGAEAPTYLDRVQARAACAAGDHALSNHLLPSSTVSQPNAHAIAAALVARGDAALLKRPTDAVGATALFARAFAADASATAALWGLSRAADASGDRALGLRHALSVVHRGDAGTAITDAARWRVELAP